MLQPLVAPFAAPTLTSQLVRSMWRGMSPRIDLEGQMEVQPRAGAPAQQMSYAEGVRAYIDGRVQTRAAICLILTICLCLFLTGNLVDVDMPRNQLNTWLAVLVTPPGVFAVFSVIFPELDCASSGTTIAAAFTMFSACALSACLIWAKQLSRPHRCWPFVVSIGVSQARAAPPPSLPFQVAH